ncbi:dTDP-4-dehydrorhamnose 3,5-epimerase family protein, partial [Pseudomonas yamanorum]
ADYTPDAEGGLSVHDPRLAIAWPEAVKNLSARDSSHPLIDTSFPGVRL